MPHPEQHQDRQETVLRRAFLLIAGFMLVEVAGGILANSLTLLADAGHMFLDATALGLAWGAMHLSRRSSDNRLSFGYHRFQVLAAFLNGLTLAVLVLWILYEAYERIRTPQAMLPIPALIIASIGFAVNLVAYRWLHGAERNANVRAAALHVLGDLLGSAAAIIAATVVYFTGWTRVDPLLALIVAFILGRGAWRVLREAAHILLEGVPKSLDLGALRDSLASVQGVVEVHHLHAWSLTAERPLVTVHARVAEETDIQPVVQRLKSVLTDKFGVDHSTIQVEKGPCPDEPAAMKG
ncbi:MAG: cation diffusion facilitator family transporter [Gammaproteobacteria bacterium]|nr:cation diffusion facilitator family transporter [Gammaproteobacteria bacterium]MDE0364985.1 cation diffusion facilitator family transporter [Gammaproteobacteria bacterium]